MKKTITFIFAAIFIFASIPLDDCYGKGFSGGGRSFSSPSRSYSSPSPSRSYSSPSPSPSPSKTFSGSTGPASGSASKFSGGDAPGKKTSDTYNAQTRSNRPNIDTAGAKARDHEVSANNYAASKPTVTKTEIPKYDRTMSYNREARQATTYANRQPTGYYTYNPGTTVIYRDRYDDTFMHYVTMSWLFHHWDNIDHSRFDNQRVQELERKFKELDAKGVKRDPNYVESGIDPDLTVKKEAAYKEGSGWLWWTFIATIVIAVIATGAWYVFIRRRPYGDY